jgi:hypothetical protein
MPHQKLDRTAIPVSEEARDAAKERLAALDRRLEHLRDMHAGGDALAGKLAAHAEAERVELLAKATR